jgi:hypothetical protein
LAGFGVHGAAARGHTGKSRSDGLGGAAPWPCRVLTAAIPIGGFAGRGPERVSRNRLESFAQFAWNENFFIFAASQTSRQTN